jgi:hypothetical protein
MLDDHHQVIDDDLLHDYEGDVDPHNEIVRLEVRIEQLAAKTESCRKFILVSRNGVWGGGIVLGAILLGVIRFDLGIMRPAFRNVTCKESTR